jgi:hypothetical protein
VVKYGLKAKKAREAILYLQYRGIDYPVIILGGIGILCRLGTFLLMEIPH